MPGGSGEVVSRRARPAKAPLSRDGIVATGLDLLGEQGLPGLSLRKIAAALDTGPASLYAYVANLEELRALVLDKALGDVAHGVGQGREWRPRLKAILTSYVEVLLAKPGLAPLATTTIASGPNAMRLTESLLEALIGGGVDPAAAAWGVDLLLLQVTGIAAEQSARRSQGDVMGRVAKAYAEAPAHELPLVHALHKELFSGPGSSRFGWALDVLITGITQAPRPPTGSEPGHDRPGHDKDPA
ncbi:MAG TPA: TetR/AcrR family transcriptional regulator [Pseudonocardia sp.]|jgi:AcrR family transcriptional regulator|nr:TetR/AcrR family transcriptional regulator [Pseudonocardia sp.]